MSDITNISNNSETSSLLSNASASNVNTSQQSDSTTNTSTPTASSPAYSLSASLTTLLQSQSSAEETQLLQGLSTSLDTSSLSNLYNGISTFNVLKNLTPNEINYLEKTNDDSSTAATSTNSDPTSSVGSAVDNQT
jgi:hypothetical protein